ncbi:hypothetical protein J6590_058971 [Homalodisca vitripennis]|nr:hypothetical protein J6590_058971 [Homalodisca vitripennis]
MTKDKNTLPKTLVWGIITLFNMRACQCCGKSTSPLAYKSRFTGTYINDVSGGDTLECIVSAALAYVPIYVSSNMVD